MMRRVPSVSYIEYAILGIIVSPQTRPTDTICIRWIAFVMDFLAQMMMLFSVASYRSYWKGEKHFFYRTSPKSTILTHLLQSAFWFSFPGENGEARTRSS